jgi:hypothetical protein
VKILIFDKINLAGKNWLLGRQNFYPLTKLADLMVLYRSIVPLPPHQVGLACSECKELALSHEEIKRKETVENVVVTQII